MKVHNYKTKVEWTGNLGKGTLDYKSFSRDHIISGVDKNAKIEGSSDPSFMGDPARYNPEEMLVSSISSCHMLWYLHLCVVNGVTALKYIDNATGLMEEATSGSGKFKEVTLYPEVVIKDISKTELAHQLHAKANEMCFIANSCNFPIKHSATINGGA